MQKLPCDAEGYLRHLEDWTQSAAEEIAEKEGIKLTENHWKVINFLRDFYGEYQLSPTMRVLIKLLREKYGEEFAVSSKLYHLFPEGPVKQGCKIAGLPKPPHCM